MENKILFSKKNLEENSNSELNLITRKEIKRITNESRNKQNHNKRRNSSNSNLLDLKNKLGKEKISISSNNRSLTLNEEIAKENMKKKSNMKIQKEKRYIVDNMEDILSKISDEKIKLLIQEIFLYIIVSMVCIYHWMFLFISRDKMELNFCFNNEQFESCSEEQICKGYSSQLNIILFNNTLSVENDKSADSYNFFIQENTLINEYYKSFCIEYSNSLSNGKSLNKFQIFQNSKGTINFAIVLSKKEKWNLFYRNFNLCEAKNYFVIFVIMVSFGGILGSLVFGFLSDIFGRKYVIRMTLLIITIMTFLFSFFSYVIDQYCLRKYKEFDNDYKQRKFEDTKNYNNIIRELFVQAKVRDFFKKIFFIFAIIIFFLSAGLWPLLKSCMALLIENAKSELNVLIGFRRYNFFFGGIPAFLTSLIFVNLNNFTLTFFILGLINFFLYIYSLVFLEESIRYLYEYCEWPELTELVLKIYKVDIDSFKTLNEEELKKFRKEENIKSFNRSVQNNNYFLHNDGNEISYIFQNSYFNLLRDRSNALKRNIKRDTDFIIRLQNVRSNPFIIINCIVSNRTFNNSKILILVILILLYVTMNLIQKEFLETPYFSMKDLYINSYNNILVNSVFFFLIISNYFSNLFFYALYRINCFKTVIIISLIYNIFALFAYHMLSSIEKETPIYFNQYNPNMLKEFNKENLSVYFLFILFSIYFLLNGVNFYVYLLILKISKTIYRCTYFSIHSISLIIAFIITECIHLMMNHYFLYLAVLNVLCLLTFTFLSEFNELLYLVNDLKIDIHRPSKNIVKQKSD